MNGLLADSLIVIDGDCLVVSIGSNFFLKREKQFCGSKVFPHRHSKTLHTKTPIDYNYEYLLQFIYSYRDWMDESWPVVMRDASRSKNQLELVDYRPVGSSVSTQWKRGGITSRMRVCVCLQSASAGVDRRDATTNPPSAMRRLRHILHRAPPAGTNISIYLSIYVRSRSSPQR